MIKQFARRVLPENFDFERKQGFSVPLESWMKSGPWRDILNDTLLSQQCLFDKGFIRNMIKGFDSGRNNSERLFLLVV